MTSPWHVLIVAVAAALPGFLSWMQSRKNHKTFNSKMDVMMKLVAKSARAEGKLEGIEEQKLADQRVSSGDKQ